MLVSVWACSCGLSLTILFSWEEVLTEKAKDKNAKGLHYRINESLVFEVVFSTGLGGGGGGFSGSRSNVTCSHDLIYLFISDNQARRIRISCPASSTWT